MLLTDKYADKIHGIITCYDRIQNIIAETGKTEGLIHIFSAMECCNTYRPWHDKTTGKTFLKFDQSKCLHYYFYFIDRELGLCYLRVPT